MLIEFNGFATLGPPTKQEVINYYEDKMTSYANNQISVSTDYSEIIIEHTTQYEKSGVISKGDKNGKKITNDERK